MTPAEYVLVPRAWRNNAWQPWPIPNWVQGLFGGKNGSGNRPLVLETTLMAVTEIVSYTGGRDIEPPPESIHLRYGMDTTTEEDWVVILRI